jgi:hypothetical protein
MTTQDDELAGPADNAGASSDAEASNDSETPKEKPEPDDAAKEKAADMMAAYEDRPTLVLPGTGGTVSGTAVNDWLDDEGNPKAAGDGDAPTAKAKSAEGESPDDDGASDDAQSSAEGIGTEEQMEKDKEFNKAVLEAAERGAPDDEAAKAQAGHYEKSVIR